MSAESNANYSSAVSTGARDRKEKESQAESQPREPTEVGGLRSKSKGRREHGSRQLGRVRIGRWYGLRVSTVECGCHGASERHNFGVAAAHRPSHHSSQRRSICTDRACWTSSRVYGPGPHRAPCHTRIHQVPSGKQALRSPSVHFARARVYCARNVRNRLTASVAAPRCPAAAN